MKKNFITGFIILFPILVTYFLITFIVNFLTAPFVGITRITSQAVILLALLLITLAVGLLASFYFVKQEILDNIMFRIPLVNRLYKGIKDVFCSFFHNEKKFSEVVLVPFPGTDTYTLGFKTKNHENSHVHIFVAGSPNPSMGFMLSYPKEKIIPVNIEVQKAFKFILSCGVIYED